MFRITLILFFQFIAFTGITKTITVVVMDAFTLEPCVDCTVKAKGNGSNSGEYKLDENGEVTIEYKRRVVLTGHSPKKNYFGNFHIYKKKHNIDRATLWVYPNEKFERNYYQENNCEQFKDSIKELASIIDINYQDEKYQKSVFGDGPKEMQQFLNTTLVYPEISREMGDQGKIYAEFIVDDNGQVKCPQIIRGVSKELDAETMRLIRKMSRWNAAVYDGDPIPVMVRFPINFELH